MQLLRSRVASVAGVVAVGAVSFAVTTALVAGASAQPAQGQPEPFNTASPTTSLPQVEAIPISDVREVSSASDVRFPIDSFRPDPSRQNVLLRAEAEAVQECMDGFGVAFEYDFVPVPAENRDYDRLFGILDLGMAQEYGYRVPGDVILESGESVESGKPAGHTPVDEKTMSLLDGDVSTMRGEAVPRGGCLGQARESVGDDGVLQGLYEAAVNYSLGQSDRDPRVLEGFVTWSKCMAERGLSYATPMDAINDPSWATPTATEKEVEVAVADVECKQATNLTGLRVAVAAAWQERFIASHASEFDAAERGVEEHLIHADALLNNKS